MRRFLPCLLGAVLLPLGGWAGDLADEKQATFGAVESPVTLPSGAASTYAYAGVPELGVGYRQGIGPIELEARLRLNYFDMSFAGEGLLKLNVFHRGPVDFAPRLGVGLVANAGAQYVDTSNFSYVGFRILPGAVAGYRLYDSVRALAEFEVPVDILLNHSGGSRVGTLLGGGAELYVGHDVSVLVMGDAGVETLQSSGGSPTTVRFDYALKLGLGWRMF